MRSATQQAPKVHRIAQGLPRKVDIRLPGKGDSNSHGARPVHQKHRWTRTNRLSIKISLSLPIDPRYPEPTLARSRRYRGTSLIRKCTPLGPYCRLMPRVLGWSWGGGCFLVDEVPLYSTLAFLCMNVPLACRFPASLPLHDSWTPPPDPSESFMSFRFFELPT